VRAADLARMVDVLKGTWIYKLKAKEDRESSPAFTASSIKDVVFQEDQGVPFLLIVAKDGIRRFGHPAEFSMTELEAITSWAENQGRKPRNRE